MMNLFIPCRDPAGLKEDRWVVRPTWISWYIQEEVHKISITGLT